MGNYNVCNNGRNISGVKNTLEECQCFIKDILENRSKKYPLKVEKGDRLDIHNNDLFKIEHTIVVY